MNDVELQEEVDIDDEMNGEDDDDDTDADLLLQALRERLRAAAYLQLLGQKLPFGFHFGLVGGLPPANEAFKKAGPKSSISKTFCCPDRSCGAKFSTLSALNDHIGLHKQAVVDNDVKDDQVQTKFIVCIYTNRNRDCLKPLLEKIAKQVHS